MVGGNLVSMMAKAGTAAAAAISVVALLAGAVGVGSARAEEDCLAAPNAPAPPGSHWYYRTDRAKQVKCWHLGTQGQPNQGPAVGEQTNTAPAAPAAPAAKLLQAPPGKPSGPPVRHDQALRQSQPLPDQGDSPPAHSDRQAAPDSRMPSVRPLTAPNSVAPWVPSPAAGPVTWTGVPAKDTAGPLWPAAAPASDTGAPSPPPPSAGQPLQIEPPASADGQTQTPPAQNAETIVEKTTKQTQGETAPEASMTATVAETAAPPSDRSPPGGMRGSYLAVAANGITGAVLFANALGLLIAGICVRRLLRRIMTLAAAR